MQIVPTKNGYNVNFEGTSMHFNTFEEAQDYIQTIESWLR